MMTVNPINANTNTTIAAIPAHMNIHMNSQNTNALALELQPLELANTNINANTNTRNTESSMNTNMNTTMNTNMNTTIHNIDNSPINNLLVQILNASSHLPPSFLQDLYASISHTAGEFLHKLDDTIHSEPQIRALIHVFPDALHHRSSSGSGSTSNRNGGVNGGAGAGGERNGNRRRTGNRLPIESAMDCKTSMSFIPFLAEEGVKLQSRRARELELQQQQQQQQQRRQNIGNDVNMDVDVGVVGQVNRLRNEQRPENHVIAGTNNNANANANANANHFQIHADDEQLQRGGLLTSSTYLNVLRRLVLQGNDNVNNNGNNNNNKNSNKCTSPYLTILQRLHHSRYNLLRKSDIRQYDLLYHSCSIETEHRFEFLAAMDPQALKDHRVGGNLIMNAVCWKKKSFGVVLRAGLRYYPHELGFCYHKENTRRNANAIRLNNGNAASANNGGNGNANSAQHDEMDKEINCGITAYDRAIRSLGKERVRTTIQTCFEQIVDSGDERILQLHQDTNVYPFMKATSDINAVYFLLRRDPSVCDFNYSHVNGNGNRDGKINTNGKVNVNVKAVAVCDRGGVGVGAEDNGEIDDCNGRKKIRRICSGDL